MLALEGIYKNGQVTILEPMVETNKTAKVVVLFIEDEHTSDKHAMGLAKLQESTGFSKDVLGSPAEDVWNDI